MKKFSFAAIMLVIPLVFIEASCSWFSAHYGRQLFSYRNEYMRSVRIDEFQRFVASPYFDARLGWNNPKENSRVTRPNCVGEAIEYVYEDGARQTPGVSPGQAQVALFGESFTQGEEVGPDSTIASVLTHRHGLPTANYGVNAYDPLQAVEKFEDLVSRPHRFKVAVLTVMHENIWRVVNSFKPIYFPYYSDFYFGLKPYVRHGEIAELAYPVAYEDFLREVDQRFESDYWAKPERQFPYSVSTVRALFSVPFKERIWALWYGRFRLDYESEELRKDLSAVIDRFVSAADAAAITPLVIFVPKERKTYRVSESYVAAENARLGRTLAYEFVDPGMDWTRYRLASHPDYCHPSPYGYARIADFVAGVIRERSSFSQR
jgi:hypothetical protein